MGPFACANLDDGPGAALVTRQNNYQLVLSQLLVILSNTACKLKHNVYDCSTTWPTSSQYSP